MFEQFSFLNLLLVPVQCSVQQPLQGSIQNLVFRKEQVIFIESKANTFKLINNR